MVIAIHLNDQRARLWKTNLTATLESLTNMRLATTATGWSLKKHHAPNLLELVHVGEWTVLGAAQDHNALLAEMVARIGRDHAPFIASSTNFWLEADVDLPRIGSAMGRFPRFPANLPRISLTVLGEAQNVRTRGELTFPGSESVKLEAWNIPTNLIQGDLTSFSAIRGLRPWLASSKVWTTTCKLVHRRTSFYIWALFGFPFETYFLSPASGQQRCVSCK